MNFAVAFASLKAVGEVLLNHSIVGVRGPYWYVTLCVYLATLGGAIYASAHMFGFEAPASWLDAGVSELDPGSAQGELIEFLKSETAS